MAAPQSIADDKLACIAPSEKSLWRGDNLARGSAKPAVCYCNLQILGSFYASIRQAMTNVFRQA
jgi:hypothetical protein